MSSAAWKHQAFRPDALPTAIEQSDFVAPSSTSITSHDTRKNFTDVQETAQWLGGVDVPTKILETLGVGSSAGLSSQTLGKDTELSLSLKSVSISFIVNHLNLVSA